MGQPLPRDARRAGLSHRHQPAGLRPVLLPDRVHRQQSLPWLDAVLAQLDENRALVSRLLAEHMPGVRYLPPEASFLAWLDCTELDLGDDPAAAFLDRGRVALSPGPDFGTQGSGFARLNIGTSPELLGETVRRMSAALHHPR